MLALPREVELHHFPGAAGVRQPIAKAHGGGGDPETLEGTVEDRRIAIIEFPDRAAADTYYNDPDYVPVRAIRWEAAQTEIILVDGV